MLVTILFFVVTFLSIQSLNRESVRSDSQWPEIVTRARNFLSSKRMLSLPQNRSQQKILWALGLLSLVHAVQTTPINNGSCVSLENRSEFYYYKYTSAMYCFCVFALENDTYFDGCLMTWIFEQRALYLSFTLSFTCFMWQVTEVDERPRALTLESIENPLNSIRYDTNATRLLFRVLFLSHPAIHANRNKLNDRIRIQSHRQWADDNYQQIKCYDHLIQSVVIFFMYVSRPCTQRALRTWNTKTCVCI